MSRGITSTRGGIHTSAAARQLMPSRALKPQDDGGTANRGGGDASREGGREGGGGARARSAAAALWGNSSPGNLSCVWPPPRERGNVASCRPLAVFTAPIRLMTMMTIIMISDELFRRERAAVP